MENAIKSVKKGADFEMFNLIFLNSRVYSDWCLMRSHITVITLEA